MFGIRPCTFGALNCVSQFFTSHSPSDNANILCTFGADRNNNPQIKALLKTLWPSDNPVFMLVKLKE
jgi:hypothetical protein